jgi:hypothetical protein
MLLLSTPLYPLKWEVFVKSSWKGVDLRTSSERIHTSILVSRGSAK